jgi:hypothetical protein
LQLISVSHFSIKNAKEWHRDKNVTLNSDLDKTRRRKKKIANIQVIQKYKII